jgi:hypothetical protein
VWLALGAAGAAASGWSIQPTPNPLGAGLNVLNNVSCSSPRACLAVGYFVPTGSSSFSSLAERWNGLTWQIHPTSSGILTNVSCPARSDCVAVGAQPTGAGTAPLAQRWYDSRWQVQPVAVPAGATQSYFEGVSCATPRACTAVGAYFTSPDTYFTLAEYWNGSTWRIQPTPNPAGSSADQFDNVSCVTRRACTAVGFSGGVPLAERWDGANWKIQSTAVSATVGGFQDVSCPKVRACVAIGGTFSEIWNGSTWQIQPTPEPSASSELVAVSCARPRACTAVGSSFTSSNTYSTLAEYWDGSTWQIQPTPNAVGATTGSLITGVWCTATGSCIAAGYYFTNSGSSTLVERFSP